MTAQGTVCQVPKRKLSSKAREDIEIGAYYGEADYYIEGRSKEREKQREKHTFDRCQDWRSLSVSR